MTDESTDAEELLQRSKEQNRHTTEPTPTTEETVNRVDAIKTALEEIDAGDTPENINIRDARLKALFIALDETDELGAIAQTAQETLDTDADIDIEDATQSDVTRLLLRVGLQETMPDVLDDATEARKQKAVEDATSY